MTLIELLVCSIHPNSNEQDQVSLTVFLSKICCAKSIFSTTSTHRISTASDQLISEPCVIFKQPPGKVRTTSLKQSTALCLQLLYAAYANPLLLLSLGVGRQYANKLLLSWKLYIIFAAICYLISIVIFLFYPVGRASSPTPSAHMVQETAGKTLEEMDFLFLPNRNIFVFQDKEATKIGAIFERDMWHGEALTAFGLEKGGSVEQVEGTADVSRVEKW